MRRERFVNNAATTLASGITSVQTTMVVDDGTVFPSEGDFRLRVADEIMLCTARSGGSLTIVRGQEGTSAADHSTGDVVRCILTSEALNTFMAENAGIYLSGASGSPPLRLTDGSGDPLTASSFTWVNQGTASVSDGSNGLVAILDPSQGSGTDGRYLVLAQPTPPFVFTWGGYGVWRNSGGAVYPQCGPCLRDSTSGRITNLVFHCRETDQDAVEVSHLNSPTSYNSSPLGLNPATRGPIWWGRIEDDNVDHKFSISYDGVTWIEIFSETRTTWLAAQDQVGFFFNRSSNNSSANQWVVTRHFSLE